jgi:nicotinate-nucleotide adenylyltransferase
MSCAAPDRHAPSEVPPPHPPEEDPTGGLLRRVRLLLPVLEADDPAAEPGKTGSRPLRVGLLGGSFNPAHEGHRYVSIEALRTLQLDQVWWLVSPQNPLKSKAGMAPIGERLEKARKVARHPRIKVTTLEGRLHTRYTVDTMKRLRAWKGYRFVWLLGADNLAQLPRWKQWTELFACCPIAVFERVPYSYRALAGVAALRFANARVGEQQARDLAQRPPPGWVYLRLRPHPASSTEIRQGRLKRGGS